MTIVSDSNSPRQVNYSQDTKTPSRYESDKPVHCGYCNSEIADLLTQAALVWRRVVGEKSTTLTAFHITCTKPECVNNLFHTDAITCWLPLSDFYRYGKFVFDYFFLPRFDNEGKWVDYDVQVHRASLARIEIALAPLKIETRFTANNSFKRNRSLTGRNGYVYLIQSPTGAYKIGKSNNPDDRVHTFEVKLPFEIEYICKIRTDDMHRLESDLHWKFSEKRINGEWFNLSPDDVEYIKGLAK